MKLKIELNEIILHVVFGRNTLKYENRICVKFFLCFTLHI